MLIKLFSFAINFSMPSNEMTGMFVNKKCIIIFTYALEDLHHGYFRSLFLLPKLFFTMTETA
jgi:hypothetical protein